MYKYLFNSSSTTPLDETWKSKISEALQKHHIESSLDSWHSEEDLANKLNSISKSTTNTLVVIGNDKDFAALIGMLGELNDDIAIGYVPLNDGEISQRLAHKSWESAIEALAQRRIHETKIFSVGKRFFLDSISLNIQASDNHLPIIVAADTKLNLRLPDCKLRFENISDDQYLSKMPLFFSAESIHQRNEPAKLDLLGGLRNKLKISSSSQKHLVASLHGKVFHIESAGEISDNLGRSYKHSLWVGKNSKSIRLITGRQARPT